MLLSSYGLLTSQDMDSLGQRGILTSQDLDTLSHLGSRRMDVFAVYDPSICGRRVYLKNLLSVKQFTPSLCSSQKRIFADVLTIRYLTIVLTYGEIPVPPYVRSSHLWWNAVGVV